jgi:hypothetical protein
VGTPLFPRPERVARDTLLATFLFLLKVFYREIARQSVRNARVNSTGPTKTLQKLTIHLGRCMDHRQRIIWISSIKGLGLGYTRLCPPGAQREQSVWSQ